MQIYSFLLKLYHFLSFFLTTLTLILRMQYKKGAPWTHDTPSLSFYRILLELCVLWCTWEWNHITDVLHTSYEEYQTLETESETCVWA